MTMQIRSMPLAKTLAQAVIITVATVSLIGCASTARNIDPQNEYHVDARYDFSDKQDIVATLSSSLLADPEVNEVGNRPVIISYGIANETSEHINTGGIADDIRANLIKSKQFRFLNRRQRQNIGDETDYQYAGFVPVEERVSEGRQLGADYILSGTLRSIEKKQPRQIRLNERRLIYYSMTLELTNLSTGEISWTDNVEIAREASQPIIGW